MDSKIVESTTNVMIVYSNVMYIIISLHIQKGHTALDVAEINHHEEVAELIQLYIGEETGSSL